MAHHQEHVRPVEGVAARFGGEEATSAVSVLTGTAESPIGKIPQG